MKTLLAVAACAAGLSVLAVQPVAAQGNPGWSYFSVDAEHSARVSDGGDELVIRCKGMAREIVLYLDTTTLDPALRGQPSAVLAVVVDGAGSILWLRGRLIADGRRTSIGFANSNADQFAHSIALATRSVAASLLLGDQPRPDTPRYNSVQFPAAGAAAAIKAAYDGCGIPF